LYFLFICLNWSAVNSTSSSSIDAMQGANHACSGMSRNKVTKRTEPRRE
jgi:hypothetical protein